MATEAARRESANKMIDRLIKLRPDDPATVNWANQLRTRFKLPMATVLAKVPGASVKEKALKIGISRQNYYCWLDGQYRPNDKQAKKLEQLTGIPAEDIR